MVDASVDSTKDAGHEPPLFQQIEHIGVLGSRPVTLAATTQDLSG